MISDEILDRLREHAAPLGRYELTALLERYEQLRPQVCRWGHPFTGEDTRDPQPQACVWGHPYAQENTLYHRHNGSKYCRHCNIVQQRAVRAGMTMADYYKRHPETVEYQGFPVAGAKIGRPV